MLKPFSNHCTSKRQEQSKLRKLTSSQSSGVVTGGGGTKPFILAQIIIDQHPSENNPIFTLGRNKFKYLLLT